jgi:hypothetical protein
MVVPDVESTDPAEMEAHQVTQEMVTGRTATLESLVRLTGAVAFEGALAIRETAEAGDAEFLAGAVNGTNETLFIVNGDLSTGKYYPLASEPFRLGELLPGVPDALSQNLTAAVAAIGSARQADFTLAWWAREGLVYAVPPAAEDTRLKLVLAESGVDIPRLQVRPHFSYISCPYAIVFLRRQAGYFTVWGRGRSIYDGPPLLCLHILNDVSTRSTVFHSTFLIVVWGLTAAVFEVIFYGHIGTLRWFPCHTYR